LPLQVPAVVRNAMSLPLQVPVVVPNATVFAVASSCRHPERSEGSRRTPLARTARTFQPSSSSICLFSGAPTRPRHFDRSWSQSHRGQPRGETLSQPHPLLPSTPTPEAPPSPRNKSPAYHSYSR
jgi:hypothetical protein